MLSMQLGTLVLASFLASAVEAVEALTIVLAAGISRGWRSALMGTLTALLALAVLIAALGPALTQYIQLNVLQVVVGALLLVFGMQWLRKAVLRASGYKALHDEEAIYRAEMAALSADAHASAGLDWMGFVVAFKGVFLEGLEVAFIVITFGSTAKNVPAAAAGAALALLVVVAAGALARHPLSRVPENTIKFAVGLLLTAFGVFWGAEGVGVEWPGGDAAIPAIGVFLLLVSLGLVAVLKRQRAPMAEALAATGS